DLIVSPAFNMISIYPQNDDAGQKWAKSIVDALPGFIIGETRVPKQFKDLNEWTLSQDKRTREMRVKWSDRFVLCKSTVHGIQQPGALCKLLDDLRAYLKRYIVFQSDA